MSDLVEAAVGTVVVIALAFGGGFGTAKMRQNHDVRPGEVQGPILWTRYRATWLDREVVDLPAPVDVQFEVSVVERDDDGVHVADEGRLGDGGGCAMAPPAVRERECGSVRMRGVPYPRSVFSKNSATSAPTEKGRGTEGAAGCG